MLVASWRVLFDLPGAQLTCTLLHEVIFLLSLVVLCCFLDSQTRRFDSLT